MIPTALAKFILWAWITTFKVLINTLSEKGQRAPLITNDRHECAMTLSDHVWANQPWSSSRISGSGMQDHYQICLMLVRLMYSMIPLFLSENIAT
jgi:hypothetical protein